MMEPQPCESPENPPLITAAVTCFNAAGTIDRALDSARRQTWPNLEILVVDDGSVDDSVQRVERAASVDPRIRLLCHGSNRGTAEARNTLVRNAAGEFIAFFDDDDVSAPDRLAKQWRRITDYEAARGTDRIFCYTNREVITGSGSDPHNVYFAIGRKPPEPAGPIVADYLLWHYENSDSMWGHVGSCTLMFRRSLVGVAGTFDARFRRFAEWDWAIRLAFEGGHFIAVDEALVTQYITRTADKSDAIPLEYSLLLRRKYKDHLKRRRLYSASIAIAHSRFHYARGHRLRSLGFLALACFASRGRVFANELSKRRRARR